MEEYDMNVGKRLKRLNLNAPILSARNLGACSPSLGAHQRRASCDSTSKRVPFSWEQVPGTPKGVKVTNKGDEVPPPKPPPCRWHPSGSPEENNDDFLDAADMFSASEMLDVEDGTSGARGLGHLDLDTIESSSYQSSNFIIQRFLPDASALAFSGSYAPISSTSENLDRGILPQLPVEECVPRRSFSKACGFGFLFPWRMKYAACGVKNPVRHASQNLRVNGRGKQNASIHNRNLQCR